MGMEAVPPAAAMAFTPMEQRLQLQVQQQEQLIPNQQLHLQQLHGSGVPRQPSVYNLTFDEFQRSVCGPGLKQSIGSMNMDEFLKMLFTADENHAVAGAAMAAPAGVDQSHQIALARQASILKQNSLTIPQGMSRKTVDEVWQDINGSLDLSRGAGGGQQQRQHTFGEMTLEDFLQKAGLVKEDLGTAATVTADAGVGIERRGAAAIINSPFGGGGAFQAPYGQANMHSARMMIPESASRSSQTPAQTTLEAIQNAANQQHSEWMSYQLNNASQMAVLAEHKQQQQQQQAAMAAVMQRQRPFFQKQAAELASALTSVPNFGNFPSSLVISPRPQQQQQLMEARSPVSPTTPTGTGVTTALVAGQNDTLLRERKRGGDVVEKVVERRQRRMIKNRESAARSRARKQAYTVELEAEVDELKSQNEQLRKQQVKIHREVEEQRRKRVLEVLSPLVTDNKSEEQPAAKALRRTRTGPW